MKRILIPLALLLAGTATAQQTPPGDWPLYARDNSLRLSVSDNGPGIEPATLARLGEPFFTTKTTGTGLGLAVVQAVVRAHRGELRLRSHVGRGTCATLVLPLITAAQPDTQE